MKRLKLLRLSLLLAPTFASLAIAAPEKPSSGPAPGNSTSTSEPAPIRLTQKDVAELILKQGQKAAEVNYQFLQARFEPAKIELAYDWRVSANYGFELDKTQQFQPITIPGSTYRRISSTASLSKAFTTGSLLGLDYARLSQRATYDYLTPLTPTGPTALTQDLFDITLEQNLLNNAFGRADRATIRAAEQTFEAAAVARTGNLQQVVLEAIRAYWDAYVARETFQEALASRERYKNLVAQIKRKTSLGYATPGELSQVQAEYEGQEQSVKNSGTDYLAKSENLATLLNLPSDRELEFVVDSTVPPVPKLIPRGVEDLRTIRAQKLRVSAADNKLVAARSTSYPQVNLVGKLYSTGFDETSGSSFASAAGGTHPKYYAGIKVVYNFGSGYQNEDILNKKVTKDLEATRLERQKLEQNNLLVQSERKVQANFAIVQSALEQNKFRAKAVQELTRTYTQGRTDIKLLIDAINNQFATEVLLSRAIGNYNIALNEWAAARDELIPDSKEEKP